MKPNPFKPPYLTGYVAGQGGYLAAVMRGHVVNGVEQPAYALIASEAAAGEFISIWGNRDQSVDGANSRHDGKANTEAMAAAGCPAALKVKALVIEGHSDWYVPSLGELNAAASNAPELFSKGWHWTSTQYSRNLAFVQLFEYGDSSWDSKDGEFRVRAFRRIPLEALTT
ncbi:hypothetical protein PMI15_00262 [Polaromonas sp. CF318]|uniref:DUF1566 domain-containing protein n=1 Tax=Polaromonas sp. CF318 TaxID=1144318 RepID=UPI0002710F99|nr:DUF1566 domain-containing protein [Polaromonas sp. CF318]EJL90449.1 hypothetical protein PMI15_00262 [Polaromonas sp. CF318]